MDYDILMNKINAIDENAILARQEYSGDDCLSCEFRGGMCNGQCTETHVIYNPNLETLI